MMIIKRTAFTLMGVASDWRWLFLLEYIHSFRESPARVIYQNIKSELSHFPILQLSDI